MVTATSLLRRRLRSEWRLLLAVFIGIAIAGALVASAPVYLSSLRQLAFNTAVERASPGFLSIYTYAPYLPLDAVVTSTTDDNVREAFDSTLGELNDGVERYNQLGPYIAGLPGRPLPDSSAGGGRVSTGFVQFFTGLERYAVVYEGRLPRGGVTPGSAGPMVEAVLGERISDVLNIGVGDEIVLAGSISDPARVTLSVTGLVRAVENADPYWRQNMNLFLYPAPDEQPLERGLEVDAEEPPVAAFVTEEAMVSAIGQAFPGSLVSAHWYMTMDREALQQLSAEEIEERLDDLNVRLAETMGGATPITGIRALLDDLERRTFFSSVPLLLLLTIMVATVLYYLAMMVSYLVTSRTADVALLRSRGTSTVQLLRLLAYEGVALVVLAVLVSPLVAMGLIAVAGKLPYFHQFTNGEFLPVQFEVLPFLTAAGVGVFCLVLFVTPAALGARAGLIIHRLRASRPPTIPFFQRYYLDAALLILGGLIFWELRSRGQLISGGLFTGVQINEAMLIAPVLFLTVVALLFMRLFPLFVRYLSGDSPALIHVIAGGGLAAAVAGLVFREVRAGNPIGWIEPVLVLGGFAAAYWLSNRSRRPAIVTAGLVVQALLIIWFLWFEPPREGEFMRTPTIVLVAAVPMQAAFLALRLLSSVAPVWVSLALLNMARNPPQYSWLVLLVVIVTGLGILATTVGGTLDRSREEQALYNVGADLRVAGLRILRQRSTESLKELYMTIPGVTSVSVAMRGRGSVGAGTGAGQFEFLALESQEFPYISWYREDFSDKSLEGVMRELRNGGTLAPIPLPEGVTHIQAWVNPEDEYRGLFLWFVVQDRLGNIATFTAGGLGEPGWSLLSADLNRKLEHPVSLVSINLFEPGFGAVGTSGTFLIDSVQAVGPDGTVHLLEDFEGPIGWVPVTTSDVSSDRLRITRRESISGASAGSFTFGKEMNLGIRGIYRATARGRVPIVVSSSFINATGITVGDAFTIEVGQRYIPVIVMDKVNYFPTMNPQLGVGYVLLDLELLLERLNMLTPTGAATPNELFIKEAPGADYAVRSVLYSLVQTNTQVSDREWQAGVSGLDPLVSAGWKAMVTLSVGIIIFTAGLGYVAYLLSFAHGNRNQMGFMQAMGLTRRQISGLISVEHLLVAMIGLGLGTWAGYEMSRIMVSALAVTSSGFPVVPPFILTTDWSIMGPLYVALCAVFVGALYVVNRGITRIDLYSISRLEAA